MVSVPVVVMVIVMVMVMVNFGHAQVQTPAPAPKLIVTWQVNSFVPSDYNGKVLVTPGSTVNLHLDVLEKGKPANLKGATIIWDYNGQRLYDFENSPNAQIKTSVLDSINARITVTILYGSQRLSKVLSIPFASQIVVIDAPYLNLNVPADLATVHIRPYFFNAPSSNLLTITIKAQKQTISDRYSAHNGAFDLNFSGLASGTIVPLNATVLNDLIQYESASQSTSFKIL